MATKFGRMITCLDWLQPIKTHDPSITWSSKIAWQTKIISAISVFMVTKLGKMFIYFERLLAIKLLDPLVMWSCKITRQTKNISKLPKCLWLPNVAAWWLTLRSSCSYSQMTLYFYLHSVAGSLDKLKTYLYYYNTYGYLYFIFRLNLDH